MLSFCTDHICSFLPFLLLGSLTLPEPTRGQCVEAQKLTASDAAEEDQFGWSVSVSGDTAVIGAWHDDNVGADSGSAYVFVRNGGVWTEQQKLTASDAAELDRFGGSVSVNGDTIAVGAHEDDDAVLQSGSAYVYVRNGGVWTEQQKLTALDGAAYDLFGSSVSVSGNTIVVGARQDGDLGFTSGSAYVFVRSGGVWTEQQKLTASDGAASDFFGGSVFVNADTAVVGAAFHDDPVPESGSAYVFVRTGGLWTEQQKLSASDAAQGDIFGVSVSVSGDRAVVGASGADDAGSGSGSAYEFVRGGGVWTERQKLIASNAAQGDGFGFSVSVGGDRAIVGALRADGTELNSGSAYVYNCCDAATTCSGHGSCNSQGECDCDPSYLGRNCQSRIGKVRNRAR